MRRFMPNHWGNSLDTFITEVSQDTWIFFPWDMALQYVAPYKGEG